MEVGSAQWSKEKRDGSAILSRASRPSADCEICESALCGNVLCVPCGHAVHEECWRSGREGCGRATCVPTVNKDQIVRIHGFFPEARYAQVRVKSLYRESSRAMFGIWTSDRRTMLLQDVSVCAQPAAKEEMCRRYQDSIAETLAAVDEERARQSHAKENLREICMQIATCIVEHTRAKDAHKGALERARAEQQTIQSNTERNITSLERRKSELLRKRRCLEENLRKLDGKTSSLSTTILDKNKELADRRISLDRRADGLRQLNERKNKYLKLLGLEEGLPTQSNCR
eukprot:Plantae.Rhodophyta-Purpureofilum_apyrenoidigerum.ctg8600.p1 GENE.Plantae.Rhodophyta-Purpureofilum_apyrenoidigerum.ctg8600~~Plantae.Rhodophyta-Purpureofilum_apyrenoidigerum.ctg8600.p1  ORF type:complete len:287 (-),score=36.18 Plantae.Rhodophyta-Purpureofilum_apyrenoidigerum.ctg8600:12-872(-)